MRASRVIDTEVRRRNVLECRLDPISDLTLRAIECPLSRFCRRCGKPGCLSRNQGATLHPRQRTIELAANG